MNLAGSAPKFPIAWGAGAGLAYINAIPTPSQIGINPGYASLTDGLPPLNATPIGAGGIPPRIQDWNGILNQLSLQAQWDQAGGPAVYDAAFAASVGGYPKGAVLMSQATLGRWWVNKVDGNATDPDGGGAANWQDFFALAFNNITITGAANQLAAGATFTNNGSFNLGNNAVYVTRAPGDNTTNLANTAFVTAAIGNVTAVIEGWVTANFVTFAYLAAQGFATQVYVKGLIDGFSAPQGSSVVTVSGGGGGTLSPSIGFTAPCAGMLMMWAARNMSVQDAAAGNCQLYLDGVDIDGDNTKTSLSLNITEAIAAGAHTVQFIATAGVQFTAKLSFLFVPNPPVY